MTQASIKKKSSAKKKRASWALPDSFIPVLASWIPKEEKYTASLAYKELLDAWGKPKLRHAFRHLDKNPGILECRSRVALVFACGAAVEFINGPQDPSNKRHMELLGTVLNTILAGTMVEKDGLKWLCGERGYLGIIKLEKQLPPLIASRKKRSRKYPREDIETTLDSVLKRNNYSIDSSAEHLSRAVRRELGWKGGNRAVPDCIRKIKKNRKAKDLAK